MELLRPRRLRPALRILSVTLLGSLTPLGLLVPIGLLPGCNRNFDSPLLSSSIPPPDTAAPVVIAAPKDTAKPVIIIPPKPILIESFTAEDMRIYLGATEPAVIGVLPADASSPRYEMSSKHPAIAEIRAEGILAKSVGTTTIALRALDGSEKTGRFQVTVELLPLTCILLPCDCLAKAKDREKCLAGDADDD